MNIVLNANNKKPLAVSEIKHLESYSNGFITMNMNFDESK